MRQESRRRPRCHDLHQPNQVVDERRRARFDGFGEDAPLEIPQLSAKTEDLVRARMLSPDFEDWSAAAARVGYCANPVWLRGRTDRVDTATGQILSTYTSEREPFGMTSLRCGNRREARCLSCSRVYAADTFQLIRAGVTGGKGVPEHVADNPLVFATLTAPSFGPVHGLRDDRGRCRPRTRTVRCPHGRRTGCLEVHDEDDPRLGQPLCPDCYDYRSHVTWQWFAPELWRYLTIALRRALARHLRLPPARLGEQVTVQYAKVAEYQDRGVIHFHALIRLDGASRQGDSFNRAPAGVDADVLADLVQQAAAAVRVTAPPFHLDDPGRVLAFGRQVDVRPVHATRRPDDPDTALTAEQVAGYLAKYATKSATGDRLDDAAGSRHLHQLRATAYQITDTARETWCAAGRPGDNPYALLGKWAHTLGFRGHFSTKSRRYSVTLGRLRRARHRWRALTAASRAVGHPIDLTDLESKLLADEDDETTLVISQWQYAGTGWHTEGDTALALAAAARAREYAQHRAEMKRANGQ